MLRSLILLFIGAAFLFLAVRRLRAHTLKERHALVFMLSALPLFVLAIWPTLLDVLVYWTGISASTLMLMGVCMFFLYMILELLSLVSKLDRQVSTLAQMVGIQNERELMDQQRRMDHPASSKGSSSDDTSSASSTSSTTQQPPSV